MSQSALPAGVTSFTFEGSLALYVLQSPAVPSALSSPNLGFTVLRGSRISLLLNTVLQVNFGGCLEVSAFFKPKDNIG